MQVWLTYDEMQVLFRPVNGRGGLQNLVRQLQRCCDECTGSIEVPDNLLPRINKYLYRCGGGFQRQIQMVAQNLPRVTE